MASLVTQKQYDLLLEAFRVKPAVFYPAGKAAGCDPDTAKRTWEEGTSFAPPIRDVLESERKTARDEATIAAARAANLAAVPQDDVERAKAKLASVQWHVAEGQLAHASIVNAGGLSKVVNELLQASVPLAARVKEAIKIEKFGARDGAKLLRDIGAFTRDVGAAAKDAVELARLHLGQPGQIVGVTDAVKPMTLEEAAAELEDGARTLERARRRGIVALPDGVTYEPPPGTDGTGSTNSTSGNGIG